MLLLGCHLSFLHTLSLSLSCSHSESSVMEFPEGFNQLDLLESHGHMIPVGTKSGWVEEEEGDDEDETCHTEEWYQEQELKLQDTPSELMLWAAEKNRVSDLNFEQ